MYKTTEIHFFIPTPTFENDFFIQLQHLVAAQWDTTFGGSCGIQILKKTKENKKITRNKKHTQKTACLGTPKTIYAPRGKRWFYTSLGEGEVSKEHK